MQERHSRLTTLRLLATTRIIVALQGELPRKITVAAVTLERIRVRRDVFPTGGDGTWKLTPSAGGDGKRR